MDPNIETEQDELDDIDELGTTVTFRGNTFGCMLNNQVDAMAFFGIDISTHSILLTTVTTNIPDAAVNELIILGEAQETYEDQGGDEEIIEENGDPVVEIMQGEYYIIDVKKRFDGNPYRAALVLSRNKGV